MRAQVAERLMETTLVAPADPLSDRRLCLDVAGEVVLPDALLLQGPEEARGDPSAHLYLAPLNLEATDTTCS